MSKVVIPDNIHFYRKNPNNFLSVYPSLSADQAINLDYSNSIGESEVAINLLGLPRSEERGVIYEDVPLYGGDRNRWVALVDSNLGRGNNVPSIYDPNYNNLTVSKVTKRRLKGKIDIMAGRDEMFDPFARDPYCPDGINPDGTPRLQKDAYGLTEYTFLPIVYQNADDNSINLEAYPSRYDYSTEFGKFKCETPAYIERNIEASNYKCELKSRELYRYEPGKVIGFTFGISTSIVGTAGYNQIQRKNQNKWAKWGVKNDTDSYYFWVDGTELKLVRDSIFKENNLILTKDQFLDPLDGTGPSKAKIDFSKVTMYSVEFSWYGAIGATFFVYLPVGIGDTRWIKIAELKSSNTYTIPALSDPYMRMFMELEVPYAVTAPQFLKKFGTSVYMDGQGAKKMHFAKNSSITTNEKTLYPNTRNTLAVFEIPEKERVNMGRFNRNKFFPLTLEAYFNEDVTLSLTTSIDNVIPYTYYSGTDKLFANHSYPSLTFGLSGNENINNIFYNNTGAFIYWLNSQGSGTSITYNDSLYDYAIPLGLPIYRTSNSVTINVPNNINTSEVIKHFLDNYPQIYDPSLVNRITAEKAYCLGDNQDFSYNQLFNFVMGVDMLPRIKSILRNGNKLTLNFDESTYSSNGFSNGDGIFTTNFDINHLNTTFLSQLTGGYPDYGPGYRGFEGYLGRPFGGYKVIELNTPLYEINCKLLGKKNYLCNTSFYIVNNKIYNGKVYFQRPMGPCESGFITKDKLDYLKSVNYFRNFDFSGDGLYRNSECNIQGYLRSNSVIFDDQCITFRNAASEPPNIDNLPFFRKGMPYSNIYYTDRDRLRGDYYVRRTVPSFQPKKTFFNPYIDWTGKEKHKLVFPERPTSNIREYYSKTDATMGYEFETFLGSINLNNYIGMDSSNTYRQYRVKFDDVFYLRDGIPTTSIGFWSMFLNNAQNFNSNFSMVWSVNQGVTGMDAYYIGLDYNDGFDVKYYWAQLDEFVKFEEWVREAKDSKFKSIAHTARFAWNKSKTLYEQEIVLGFRKYQLDYYSGPWDDQVRLDNGFSINKLSPYRTIFFSIRVATPRYLEDSNHSLGDDLSLYYSAYVPARKLDCNDRITNISSPESPELGPEYGSSVFQLNFEDNELYFYYTIGVDVSGNGGNPWVYNTTYPYNDGSQRIKVKSPFNNLNNKFSFIKFEATDVHGNKSSSMSPVASDNIVKINNINVMDKSFLDVSGLDVISLSGTSFSNEAKKVKNMLVNIYDNVNNPSNISASVGKDFFNFFVPKNKKFTIDLRNIYNSDRTQILPSYRSNFRNFDTFFIISGYSRSNKEAKGTLTLNFEERV